MFIISCLLFILSFIWFFLIKSFKVPFFVTNFQNFQKKEKPFMKYNLSNVENYDLIVWKLQNTLFTIMVGSWLFIIYNIISLCISSYKITGEYFLPFTKPHEWAGNIKDTDKIHLINDKLPKITDNLFVFKKQEGLSTDTYKIFAIKYDSILRLIKENKTIKSNVINPPIKETELSYLNSVNGTTYDFSLIKELKNSDEWIKQLFPNDYDNTLNNLIIFRIQNMDFLNLNYILRKDIKNIQIYSITEDFLKEHEWKLYQVQVGYDIISSMLNQDLNYFFFNITFKQYQKSFLSYVTDFLYIILISYFLISLGKMFSGKDSDSLEVEKVFKGNIDMPEYAWNDHLIQLFDEIAIMHKNNQNTKSAKWILLYWPPGCGKTLFAQYLAKKLSYPLYQVSWASFKSKFYGGIEKNIRKTYEKIRKEIYKNGWSAVLFIDELDSIWLKRENAHEASQGWLNELLTQMDGFIKDNIILIGATNRYEALDDALLSRFNEKFYVGLPSYEDRIKILKSHLENLYNKKTVNWYIVRNDVSDNKEQYNIPLNKWTTRPFFANYVLTDENINIMLLQLLLLFYHKNLNKKTLTLLFNDFEKFMILFNEQVGVKREYTVSDFLAYILFLYTKYKIDNNIEEPIDFKTAENNFNNWKEKGDPNNKNYKDFYNSTLFIVKHIDNKKPALSYINNLNKNNYNDLRENFFNLLKEKDIPTIDFPILKKWDKNNEFKELDEIYKENLYEAFQQIFQPAKDILNEVLEELFEKDGRRKIPPFIRRPLYIKQKILDKDFFTKKENLENMSYLCSWASGREIAQIIEWMFTKSIVNKEEFSFDLFWKVIEDNMLGRTKPKKQNENEIRTIAYHEMWHAVISKYVGDDVIKVSIGERSMSAGVSISIPKDHESMLKTEDKIYKEMMVAIAGKMAEKIFIGEVTWGSQNDYQKVYNTAFYQLFLCNLSYTIKHGENKGKVLKLWYIKSKNDLSEQEKTLISEYIKEMTEDLEIEVTNILEKNKDKIHSYAETLMKEKILDGKDIIVN